MNMNICLFDIDGTLISSGGAGKRALELALTHAFGVEHIIEKLQLSGRTDRAIIRDMFRFAGIADTPENLRRMIEAYLSCLPNCLAGHKGMVLPGIVALLQELAGRESVALGLLTGNIREGARVKLGHYRLYEHFAFGAFGDEHFDRDDVAREAAQVIEQQFGKDVIRQRIWVIGDTPFDVRCARAIGARAVAVATGWHPLEELERTRPDILVQDLSDPRDLLAALS
jgi:phosphoglycolate phosphatase-like HAD superfamily hydrolase